MCSDDTTQPTFITLEKSTKNLTGIRSGRLVALGPIGRTTDKKILWLCQCDCGNTTTVRANHLNAGATLSCGCLFTEKQILRNTTHGMSGTSIHIAWKGIVQRCCNPSTPNYARYGGRGITVCDEWRDSFESFYSHVSSLPNCEKEGYSLDRVDNSLGYFPGNVKYSTATDQARNRRSNHLLTFEGKTQCLAAWEKEKKLSTGQLGSRIRNGWSVERALTTPNQKRN